MIDPHTTTMLRTAYPKLVPGYDVRVRSYLEVLAERGLPAAAPLRGTVVIHDSCVYARNENVIQALRSRGAGQTVVTETCGGRPVLRRPRRGALSRQGGRGRRQAGRQLRAVAPDCVTMCPICLINLRKAAGGTMRVRDISDYVAQAAG